jgi:hypothetical protein
LLGRAAAEVAGKVLKSAPRPRKKPGEIPGWAAGQRIGEVGEISGFASLSIKAF